MKYIKFFLIPIFFFIFINNVKSDSSIYFFDLEYIFNNSNYGKLIINDLENINININQSLESDKKKIKSLEDEIIKTKNLLSDEDLNKKMLVLKTEIETYNLKKNKVLGDFDINKKNKIKEFSNKINPIIEKFVTSNNITILLNRKDIFMGKNDYDITLSILEIINKELK